jgi:hypothetical protein
LAIRYHFLCLIFGSYLVGSMANAEAKHLRMFLWICIVSQH